MGDWGMAWLWPCRHVSGFGSASPGGLSASAQPTAGAAFPSFLYADDSGCLGDLPRCLCAEPDLLGTLSCLRLSRRVPLSPGVEGAQAQVFLVSPRTTANESRPCRSVVGDSPGLSDAVDEEGGWDCPPSPSRLRFGILCQSRMVDDWLAECALLLRPRRRGCRVFCSAGVA
jgi:hypothetical protein